MRRWRAWLRPDGGWTQRVVGPAGDVLRFGPDTLAERDPVVLVSLVEAVEALEGAGFDDAAAALLLEADPSEREKREAGELERAERLGPTDVVRPAGAGVHPWERHGDYDG